MHCISLIDLINVIITVVTIIIVCRLFYYTIAVYTYVNISEYDNTIIDNLRNTYVYFRYEHNCQIIIM